MADLAVSRTVRLFADRNLSPAGLSRHLAGFARRTRNDLIQTGRASPIYSTAVDGREGAVEETVRPNGVIVYRFSSLPDVIGFILGFLEAGSARDSGAFVGAWTLAVDGKRWAGALSDIPPRARVMIVNPAPYSRKLETGAMPRAKAYANLIERARTAARARWSSYDFNKALVNLPASFSTTAFPEVPYVLRGRQRSFAVKHAARITQNRGRSVMTSRKDLGRGQLLSYPALEIVRRG